MARRGGCRREGPAGRAGAARGWLRGRCTQLERRAQGPAGRTQRAEGHSRGPRRCRWLGTRLRAVLARASSSSASGTGAARTGAGGGGDDDGARASVGAPGSRHRPALGGGSRGSERWAQASGSPRSGGTGSTLGARLRQPWRRSAVGKESRRLGGECRGRGRSAGVWRGDGGQRALLGAGRVGVGWSRRGEKIGGGGGCAEGAGGGRREQGEAGGWRGSPAAGEKKTNPSPLIPYWNSKP
jgi:hypothetical protein